MTTQDSLNYRTTRADTWRLHLGLLAFLILSLSAHVHAQLSDITQPGDPIVPTSTNSPPSAGVANAIDNQLTKYLNFDKLNTGFTVSPQVGLTVVQGLTLTSANDAPGRDPSSFILSGSYDNSNFTQIASGSVPAFTARFQKVLIPVGNDTPYLTYRVIFPTVANADVALAMQIVEVELLGLLAKDVHEPPTNAPPANDNFANRIVVTDNFSLPYLGTLAMATFEPNEPATTATNTVWVSWTATSNLAVTYYAASSHTDRTPCYSSIYTGPALDRLERVPVVKVSNDSYTFAAIQGTAYHFQISGEVAAFALVVTLKQWSAAPNDNFANAQAVTGRVNYSGPFSLLTATMESGEPSHMGVTPQKSLWWKWQPPNSGLSLTTAGDSLVTNVVLAAYQGAAVDALRMVGKGTNELLMDVVGGETYYIAAAVPANTVDDISIQLGVSDPSDVSSVPGNLLREASWEGTALFTTVFWRTSSGVGGHVNDSGGADGTTWPVLGTGAKIWQIFRTIPGHDYAIRFAHFFGGNSSGCCGEAGFRVLWDDQVLATVELPGSQVGSWYWSDFIAQASNTISRVTFENIHRSLEMDAFSVVDLSAPPVIISQPLSQSTAAGGTAAFIVEANGTRPLSYQWFFNGSPLADQTNSILLFDSVSPSQAGNYAVSVTNRFGIATSIPATLIVEAATNVTIVVQPYGDTVPVGGFHNFSVVVGGTPPFNYQWHLNGVPIQDAIYRNLALPDVQLTNAGTYQVLVQNSAGGVWSLPATLVVTTNNQSGGLIDFRNRFVVSLGVTNTAPVSDIDGFTPLVGDRYLAQLYAGPSLEMIRPVGQPTPFKTGFEAGQFVPQIVTLPTVSPGGSAVAQVRVWDSERGTSYEEARALGGKFGRSEILAVTAGGEAAPPQPLIGLKSFSLQAGLPRFNVGLIELLERQLTGDIVWSIRGEPGFRYVVERSIQPDDAIWRPRAVLTNETGTVAFTDSSNISTGTVLYRARILD